VIHTTKEFHCGIGELQIFCLDASNLLQDLVTQGRGPKSKRKSLNSNIKNFKTQRTEITEPCLKSNASHYVFNTKSSWYVSHAGN